MPDFNYLMMLIAAFTFVAFMAYWTLDSYRAFKDGEQPKKESTTSNDKTD